MAVHAAITPTATSPMKQYAGSLPKCNKCSFHHNRPCREMQCANCNRKGNIACFYKSLARPITPFPSVGVGQACFVFGEVGHYKGNCPKAGNAGRVGRFLAIGNEEAVVDPTVVTEKFLLDNSYA